MSFPGILNYEVPVRGSSVTAYLGLRTRTGEWIYSLWDVDDNVIASGTLGVVDMDITPDQAARIAFLLEVDYAG